MWYLELHIENLDFRIEIDEPPMERYTEFETSMREEYLTRMIEVVKIKYEELLQVKSWEMYLIVESKMNT